MINQELMITIFPLTSIYCGFLSFVSKRKHLLATLLSLEFIMVSIYWLMTICNSYLFEEAYTVLFFLTLVACEGALGLSLLVSVVRSHGNDHFNSINILQC